MRYSTNLTKHFLPVLDVANQTPRFCVAEGPLQLNSTSILPILERMAYRHGVQTVQQIVEGFGGDRLLRFKNLLGKSGWIPIKPWFILPNMGELDTGHCSLMRSAQMVIYSHSMLI